MAQGFVEIAIGFKASPGFKIRGYRSDYNRVQQGCFPVVLEYGTSSQFALLPMLRIGTTRVPTGAYRCLGIMISFPASSVPTPSTYFLLKVSKIRIAPTLSPTLTTSVIVSAGGLVLTLLAGAIHSNSHSPHLSKVL
jgi:hypothetical protein